MIQKIYADTSVIGGFYDTEFKDFSQPLFEKVKRGECILVYSEITEQELFDAPQKVRELINNLPNEHLEYVQLTAEADILAERYISENVWVKLAKQIAST